MVCSCIYQSKLISRVFLCLCPADNQNLGGEKLLYSLLYSTTSILFFVFSFTEVQILTSQYLSQFVEYFPRLSE